MVELQLSLDFRCGECEGRISLVVQCQGKGLMDGPETVAACKAECPHCGCVNRVCFHPTGEVAAVEPIGVHCSVPVPSMN